MQEDILKCLRCGNGMVGGVLIDEGEGTGSLRPSYWIEGFPEKQYKNFNIDRNYFEKMRYTVTAYRCKNCGYLESYANKMF